MLKHYPFRCLLLFALSVTCVLLTSCGQSQSALNQPIRKQAILEPDSMLLEKLGDRQDVDFATLQIPADFKLTETVTRGPATIYQFSSLRRDDGTAALLQVMAVKPGGTDKPMSLGVTLEKVVNGVKKRRTQWSQSQIARGLVSDLEFAHLSWEGVESTRGVAMKGVVYVTYVGTQMVSITGQDVKPMADETLPLVETAIRTLQTK